MDKNNTTVKDKGPMLQKSLWTKAFTFIEVIVALAIVSISLLALLRLHLMSIKMAETAEITSQVVFLAGEKMAEKLATGYPNEESDSGTVEKNGLPLHWQTEITNLQLPLLDNANITGLRKVLVDVSWKQGTCQKHLQMSTYVADWELNEK
jgi:type II secretion system protein I